MDIATVVGTILSILLIVGSIIVGGGSFMAFIDIPSILVVIGGSIAAALISFPLPNFLGVFGVTMKCVFWKVDSTEDVIKQIVSLSEVARREGILALESKTAEIDNDFIKLGIQMAVDGTRPEVMEDILRTELDAISTRHRDGKALLDCMGRFAPAFGMIGTLMGLVIMLGDMSDPSKIGAGMAVALLTTLYGAIASNVLFLPFAEKLGYTSKKERLTMDIIIRGVMAIQSGENPRVIEQKLNTFIPPKQRAKEAA
ncbi:motility protein A [Botrimarina mediterranea]|uniref:Chemotaxis protein PomA n=1 Tax=Botrimarina mediterranea TaxID=2528022 RepID=A0A518KBT2_9BACT|nr:motility protein A [Botrimarina mediterranea]QDV75256.1 Chemotaxis protein PomA [Botrimarina mediterranea]QDV79925.1 Chemotaxis protein PomA [Planctomycetes bacterium K2D]